MGREVRVENLSNGLVELVKSTTEKAKTMNTDDVKTAFEQMRAHIVEAFQKVNLDEFKEIFEKMKTGAAEKAQNVKALISDERVENLEKRVKKIEKEIE